MITLITGAFGSGKTLYAISLIQSAIGSDRPVVANIDGLTLQHDHFDTSILADPVNGTPTRAWLDKIEPGSLVVFDEAHNYWGVGAGQTKSRVMGSDVRDWMAQLRHFTNSRGQQIDVIAVCQDHKQLTQQFKHLVGQHYHFKRLTIIGLKGVSMMTHAAGGIVGDGGSKISWTPKFDVKANYKLYASSRQTIAKERDIGGIFMRAKLFMLGALLVGIVLSMWGIVKGALGPPAGPAVAEQVEGGSASAPADPSSVPGELAAPIGNADTARPIREPKGYLRVCDKLGSDPRICSEVKI